MLNDIGGVYCEDADVAGLATGSGGGVQPYSLDEINARRLWKLTEDMTGMAFHVS